jgi:quinoprotein relay system zinc metallohydrolase 2
MTTAAGGAGGRRRAGIGTLTHRLLRAQCAPDVRECLIYSICVTTRTFLTRRQALIAGASFCCVRALAQKRVEETRALITEEVTPGIHVRHGVDEDVTARNEDGIANIGFIVGREAVAVIDPGGSLIDGQRLRAAIRQTTQLPIKYVVMSHVHPDHIFGAPAFQSDRPQFVGHAKLPRALALRGEFYRKRLEDALGKDRAGGVVAPTMLVRDRADVDLGGRLLTVTAHGLAHTDCDLTVLDRNTGTLFTADLLFVNRVPSLDGSLRGWLKELAALASVTARRAVPGHGPTSVDWPSGAKDLERYLGTLLRETKEAIAKGMDLEAAVGTVAQSERSRWALFDDYNGHNVTQAFKELEWEQ